MLIKFLKNKIRFYIINHPLVIKVNVKNPRNNCQGGSLSLNGAVKHLTVTKQIRQNEKNHSKIKFYIILVFVDFDSKGLHFL